MSCTAPLFAVAAAVLLLGEVLDLRRAAGTLAAALGIAVLSTAGNASKAARPGARNAVDGRGMVLALGAAMLRAVAQILLKIGFVFWASPYAAILAGYTVSAAVILIASPLLARAPASRGRGLMCVDPSAIQAPRRPPGQQHRTRRFRRCQFRSATP